jgi:hypothetical protein
MTPTSATRDGGNPSASTASAPATSEAGPAASASTSSPSSATREPTTWELSADARAAWSGSLAPALGLRLALGQRLGGFFELDAAWPRIIAHGAGTVTWNRFGFGLGARYRATWERFVLEPALSLQGAALWARAAGFVKNESRVVPDLALCGHLRAGVRWGDAVFFTGVRACGWPIATRVTVASVAGSADFPVFEASVLLGVSWRWPQGSPPSGLSAP